MKSVSKKYGASQLSFAIIITLVLGILALVIVFYPTAKEYIAKLGIIPGFEINRTKVIPTDNEIPDIEKKFPPAGKHYPTATIVYYGDIDLFEEDDLFSFRWNPNLSKVQITININRQSSVNSQRKDIWMTDPEMLPGFLEGKGMNNYEISLVNKIMQAENEADMFNRISAAKYSKISLIPLYKENYNLYPTQTTKIPTAQEISDSLYCTVKTISLGDTKPIELPETSESARTISIKSTTSLNIILTNPCLYKWLNYEIYEQNGEKALITHTEEASNMNAVIPVYSSLLELIKTDSKYPEKTYKVIISCNSCTITEPQGIPPISNFKGKIGYFKFNLS